MMGTSVVIAAWGEGVNVCLCPPSPSLDRSLFTKTHTENTGCGPRTRPPLAACIPVPPRLTSQKGQKYFGGPSGFSLHTYMRQYSLIVYIIGL
jgi:hypothetical protein